MKISGINPNRGINPFTLKATGKDGRPVAGEVGRTTIVGPIPKRSRGGAGNPLASVVAKVGQETLAKLQALTPPKVTFQTADGGLPAIPVDEDGTELHYSVVNGPDGPEFSFRQPPTVDDAGETHLGEQVTDVLFRTEAGDTYTPQGVEPVWDMSKLDVEGTPAEINKMYAALTQFNKATGKQLKMLQLDNVLDANGNIIKHYKRIFRMA